MKPASAKMDPAVRKTEPMAFKIEACDRPSPPKCNPMAPTGSIGNKGATQNGPECSKN